VQPYFQFLAEHNFLIFYSFEHKKSLPTKYCIDSTLKYTSYGNLLSGPQRDPPDAFFPCLVILYYGMDIAG
jgi:hypothetical protein